MGIPPEVWRARIGSFAQPMKTKSSSHNTNNQPASVPVIVSLCIRMLLFSLLVIQGIESNLGPLSSGRGRGHSGSNSNRRLSLSNPTKPQAKPKQAPSIDTGRTKPLFRETRATRRSEFACSNSQSSINHLLGSDAHNDTGSSETSLRELENAQNQEYDMANNRTILIRLRFYSKLEGM